MTVLGRDGEPFLRLDATGVQANTGSRSYLEDQQARGRELPPAPPGGAPKFVPVSAGRTVSWLAARLRYPADLPPQPVLSARRAAVVERWQVPLSLPSGPAALTGAIRWLPASATAGSTPAGDPPGDPAAGPGARGRPAVLAGLALALAALTGAALVPRTPAPARSLTAEIYAAE